MKQQIKKTLTSATLASTVLLASAGNGNPLLMKSNLLWGS